MALEEIARRLTAREAPVRITGLRGSARAVALAEIVRAHGERPLLVVAASAKAADALAADLRVALGGEQGEHAARVRAFPRHDTLPYERFSPQPFVVAQRMELLYRWLADPGRAGSARGAGEPVPIAVAPLTALALRVPSREAVRGATVHLEVGRSIDREALIGRLVAAGYARMAIVEDRGELAVRGGIVDVFPPNAELPVRIELLGDEVESIRDFDPASQRSQHKRDSIAIAPPRELLFDRARIVAQGDRLRELATRQGAPDAAAAELIDALLRGHLPPGVEALAPLLQTAQESVFDYLPPDTLVAIDDPDAAAERLAVYEADARHNHEAAREAGRLVCEPEALLLGAGSVTAALGARHPVTLERLDVRDDRSAAQRFVVEARAQEELRRALARARTHERALTPLADQLGEWIVGRWRVTLACHSLSSAERLRALLDGYGIETRLANDPRPIWRWGTRGRVEVRVARLSEGFVLAREQRALVTEEEIFGQRERTRRRADWREGSAVEGLGQLQPGDHLVHAEHGIGTYRGLVEVAVRGLANEMLRIDYAGGDRLFLPVHRLNLVQRYGGADATPPRLDRLGGQSWERAREKVRKSLRRMAQELLSVHAARELAPGHAFSPRDAYFEEFEAAFPYEETPDQAAAIEDVLADMQRARPMDRLVCGDVGYGKTEVAARAAFRAALDGKQVAVLVPTTVLCQQHAETLEQRFEGYPIRTASLSRFEKPKRAREVLDGLADGSIDVVVGTHRLLQKRVRFRDLGLLVVDEEHRFGVTHKERIKQIKKTVDVLTLTATPIPRTLQMAFTGVRELSVINTPPADRLAVRTQVCRFSEDLVREAILREVRRGGQVFYVHNRVQSIGRVHEMLERLVPEVKVVVAHGQMKERELEDRMLAFEHGRGDVLLCTTIIESGLDIPNANTILIDRADALGLAQLYQLRGRVGRGSHRAYAYLLIPTTQDALPPDAQRRLEAIQDLSELGSGFRLANMDLEIRGAGNMLGAEQSGNLMAVGYETYMEMLEETIEELRGHVREHEVDPEIRLPVQARLPEDYVPDVSQRLVLYKRLASARDDDELARIRDEILDRYGALPRDAAHLVEVIRLKALARRLGVVAVDLVRGDVVLSVGAHAKIDPQRLVALLGQAGSNVRVTPDHRIHAPAPTTAGAEAVLEAAHTLLARLAG